MWFVVLQVTIRQLENTTNMMLHLACCCFPNLRKLLGLSLPKDHPRDQLPTSQDLREGKELKKTKAAFMIMDTYEQWNIATKEKNLTTLPNK